MNCPNCKCSSYNKDGIANGRQRFLCKKCSFRYTVEKKSDVKLPEIKRLALEMYLEGLGFRAIGRVLKISYGTVYQWVKEWRSKVELPKSEKSIAVMGLEEMYTYTILTYYIDQKDSKEIYS